ncbi:MAG TPA: HEAT repeat domain-containing protein, partial [Verrucomicrobiota bacterium]|nr:HEAT repeat domain-containing protein [Verrucomicrobiota bacterium]
VEPLLSCLKDENVVVRWSAIYALGNIGDKRAVEPLIPCLKNKDPMVRRIVAVALGKLGDKRAVEPLIPFLNEEKWFVREKSAEALGNIGDKRVVELLIPYLQDKDVDVRKSTADALRKLGYKPSNEIEKIYYYIAKQEWNKLVRIGEPAVEPLLACLKDEDAGVCGSAAYALGEIGDKKVIPALFSALPNWDANNEICQALNNLGWTPKTDAEKVYFWIGNIDIKNLTNNWELTKQVLLNDLYQDDKRKVINAAYTFIALGRKDMISDLIEALKLKPEILTEAYMTSGKEELNKAVLSLPPARRLNKDKKPGTPRPGIFWDMWKY